MTGNLVTTTPESALHALAFQGIRVFTQFPQLGDMLRRKFGEEYALLFAEPVENTGNGEIDWYTPLNGAPQKLRDAPGDIQADAAARIAAMAGNIQAYAEELANSPEPLKSTRGKALQLALCYPDDDCVYLVDGKPVFVCWGFAPGTPGVESKNLTRLVTRPQKTETAEIPDRPASAAPVSLTASGRRIPWSMLWWLIPLALACLLFIVLATSFGNRPSLSGLDIFHAPPLPFMGESKSRQPEISSLDQEISHLRNRLDKHMALCMPPAEQGTPLPQTPAVPAAPRQELVIPPKADNTEFLAGKWMCDTGLASRMTGEPVQIVLSFDAKGNGTGIVHEKDDQCTGAAGAKMQDNKLLIHLDMQQCAKSDRNYAPVNIICENAADSTTTCYGVHEGGGSWNAGFRKLQ